MKEGITPACVHWLADVHSAVFARAFPLSLGRQEIRTPPAGGQMPIASVVRFHSKKIIQC